MAPGYTKRRSKTKSSQSAKITNGMSMMGSHFGKSFIENLPQELVSMISARTGPRRLMFAAHVSEFWKAKLLRETFVPDREA